MEERTIVLLGKTGAGKSATGNTILGRNAFKSRKSLDSVTRQCEVEEAVVDGKLIRVVDTPGFFEAEMSKEELAEELARSVHLSQGGVHDSPGGVYAFILVFPYERFTEQEEEILMKIQTVFGKKVTEHMILLFTHGDEVGEDEISRSSNKHLKACVEKCGGRYLIFNNREPNNREQVTRLLGMTGEMVELNGGQRYTNEVYEAARRYTWMQFWEIFKDLFLTAAAVLLGILWQGARRAWEFSEKVKRLGIGLMSGWIQKLDEKKQHLL